MAKPIFCNGVVMNLSKWTKQSDRIREKECKRVKNTHNRFARNNVIFSQSWSDMMWEK